MADDERPSLKQLLSHDERQIVAGVILPEEGELTEGQRRDVQDAVKQYLTDNSISQRAFVRAIGMLRETSWSQVLNGTYSSGKLDEYLRAANLWIDDDARRRVTREQPEFVHTSVAETVHTAVDLAKQNRAIYVVIGPSGTGKSFCAGIAQEQSPGTILLELNSDLRTHRQIRDALVRELGLDRVRTKGSRKPKTVPKVEYSAALYRRLQGTARLIIIDEGHEIDRSGLDFLRHLHDKTGCPLLLLATIDLWEDIIEAADVDRGQFYSRVRQCIDLTDEIKGDRSRKRLFKADDVRKMFQTKRFKVHLNKDAVDYLVEVANDFGKGSLRTCKALVEDAATLSRNLNKFANDAWVTLDIQVLYQVHKGSRKERISADWVDRCFRAATAAAVG